MVFQVSQAAKNEMEFNLYMSSFHISSLEFYIFVKQYHFFSRRFFSVIFMIFIVGLDEK